MSKKKACGSTMTLKDFHGGSIPSDIPLPSAPGVVVRPTDRPSSWGNSTGRSDHRLRPNSSGSMRTLDDKTSILSNSAHIGRNFDEDERKPLDGVSGPRRIISDEGIRPPPKRIVEPKQDVVGRLSAQQSLAIGPQTGTVGGAGSYTRAVEGSHMGGGTRSVGGVQGVGGGYPNAWGIRKEPVSVSETVSSPWAGQSAVSKFAQASALDKVSSGRWQTKPVHHQADVEIIRQPDSPNLVYTRQNDSYAGRNFFDEKDSYEMSLAKYAERSISVDEGVRDGAKEVPSLERARSPGILDTKEKMYASYGNGVLSTKPEIKNGALDVHPSGEAVERPKLKLLPRTKPLSPPVEQAAEHAEKPRLEVFGGARPRELVLKERGVDDNAVNNLNPVQSPTRLKNDAPRPDPAPANTSRYSNRAESLPPGKGADRREQRMGERKEQRADGERNDKQRKNWRNENWRSSQDAEKHHQLQQERQPSPETWRKPVEQPKSAKADSLSGRNGKAVSAVELVQAFSGSVSEAKSTDQLPGRRGLSSNRPQVPFSRLMGTSTTRPQINGY